MTRAREDGESDVVRLLKEPGARDALEKLSAAGVNGDYFAPKLLAVCTLIAFDRTDSRSFFRNREGNHKIQC